MQSLSKNIFIISISLIVFACNHKEKEPTTKENKEIDNRTPVTVTSVSYDPLQEFIEPIAFVRQSP